MNKKFDLSGAMTTPFYSTESSVYDRTLPEIPYKIRTSSNSDPTLPSRVLDVTTEIKDWVNRGEEFIYPIYKDPITGKYYEDQGNIPLNWSTFQEVSPSDFHKSDYIGGSKRDVGYKTLSRIPGLKNYIVQLSKNYNINPNVFIQRLINEGYLQDIAFNYNHNVPPHKENEYWNSITDKPVSGFESLGLDTFVDHLNQGHLSLRKPIKFTPKEIYNEDNTSNKYTSAHFNNLYDALEAKAAMIEYLTKLGKQKGLSDTDLDYWVNAAYNMGENHRDLNDMEYVRKQYSFKPFLKNGGCLYLKKYNYGR